MISDDTVTQCCFNAGPPSETLAQQLTTIGSKSRVCWDKNNADIARQPTNLQYKTKKQYAHISKQILPSGLSQQTLSQQTQNICITFIQRWPNVLNVGPTLHKFYTDSLYLLGIADNYLPLCKVKKQ